MLAALFALALTAGVAPASQDAAAADPAEAAVDPRRPAAARGGEPPRIGPARPRSPEEVRVFFRSKPDQPYRVVDRITVTAADCDDVGLLQAVDDDALSRALKREAARSGADAILDVVFEDDPVQRVIQQRGATAREYETRHRRIASGTLVRFAEEAGVRTSTGTYLFFGDEEPPFPFDEVRVVEAGAGDVAGRGALDLRPPSRGELIRALLWKADGEGDALIGVEIVEDPRVRVQHREDPAHVSVTRRYGTARVEVRGPEATTTETEIGARKARGIVVKMRR